MGTGGDDTNFGATAAFNLVVMAGHTAVAPVMVIFAGDSKLSLRTALITYLNLMIWLTVLYGIEVST